MNRGRDSAEDITKRLTRAVDEAEDIDEYDYLLINDTVEQCVKDLHSIINAERMKVKRQMPFISDIKKELAELNKEE